MNRACTLGLIAALVSIYPIQAQPKSDPPKYYTNDLGMEFVWLPPGAFMMGSPKEEERRSLNEIQHKVTLSKGFYMGATTVTQEQWQEIMEKNPSVFSGDESLPVDSVSWNDCQDFIKKLREKDKKPYRLPTEAEWEFACRAGTTTPFSFGKKITIEQANFHGEALAGTEKKLPRLRTTPVGCFPANAWGLHDMHGNLWQWCQDWYGNYPEKDAVDPQGPAQGKIRVQRGGSWYYTSDFCRSACRGWGDPGFRNYSIGVRLCFYPD